MRAPVRALVVGGATALCLGGLSAPAWSAPADLCATGTTFTIAPTTQTDLADEARTALEAKGLVEDVDGNRFVDLASGIAVTSVGASAPRVVGAAAGRCGGSRARRRCRSAPRRGR